MPITDHTLMEQLRITAREIERRKQYLNFTAADAKQLMALREVVAEHIEEIVDEFYGKILPFDEMARVIGDAETLHRLRNHQRRYILTLFDGQYDEDYVHARLRVGVVHKRIGVDPKYYISAVHNLSTILRRIITSSSRKECQHCFSSLTAIEKIVMFDLALIFDTYINSLMKEAARSREELEQYTESLEVVIAERTRLLAEQARHDGLTGLLNQHSFYDELRRELSRSQRRHHTTSLIYFDLDGFKKLNDSEGHQRGDEVLVAVAQAVRATIRESDIAARYGGDEFCIIMPESTPEEAHQLGQRICDRIGESVGEAGISCSMGIAASTPDHFIDTASLVRMADEAMYEAKSVPGFAIRHAIGEAGA